MRSSVPTVAAAPYQLDVEPGPVPNTWGYGPVGEDLDEVTKHCAEGLEFEI